MKTLLIPSNLNLDQLISEYGEQRGNTLKKEDLAYIISLIINKHLNYKKMKFNDYVPLMAKYLRAMVSNSTECVNFLLAAGVLERDHYEVGVKSYGYRLNIKYRGVGFNRIEPSDKIITRQNRHRLLELDTNPALQNLYKSRAHLIKTLLSREFSVDYNKAIEYLAYEYRQNKFKEVYERKIYYSDEDTIKKEVLENAHLNEYTIRKLHNKEFIPKIDSTGYRLHSPVTNLNKKLRQFLRYNNERLVSIDLKNSQPYFSLLFLQKKFYKKNTQKLNLRGIDGEYYTHLINSFDGNNKGVNPIMMKEFHETLDNTGFPSIEKYYNDVLNGKVYDNFIRPDVSSLDYNYVRDGVKEEFFKTLYGEGRVTNFNKRFYETYPAPFKLFNYLKSVQGKYYKTINKELVDVGYGRLAVLLQRIESNLLLDVVCKRINRINKAVPIITIHDSIATTERYELVVKSVIDEELKKVVGAPPRLVTEPWGAQD